MGVVIRGGPEALMPCVVLTAARCVPRHGTSHICCADRTRIPLPATMSQQATAAACGDFRSETTVRKNGAESTSVAESSDPLYTYFFPQRSPCRFATKFTPISQRNLTEGA
jgi:hypothetical protein